MLAEEARLASVRASVVLEGGDEAAEGGARVNKPGRKRAQFPSEDHPGPEVNCNSNGISGA